MKTKLYVAKEFEDAILPTRNHDTDAGYDIYCHEAVIIPAGGFSRVKTGIRITCEEGYWWTIKSRSSMGYVKQIESYGGVMDSHFTNDTTVLVYNKTNKDYTLSKGDKFCQVVVIPLPEVELVELPSVKELEDSFAHGRGNAGWGSSGK